MQNQGLLLSIVSLSEQHEKMFVLWIKLWIWENTDQISCDESVLKWKHIRRNFI